jgi:hypothetical protein
MPDSVIVILPLLSILLQPLSIPSGLGRVGPALLPLLGSLGCLAALLIVLRFLLRPETPAAETASVSAGRRRKLEVCGPLASAGQDGHFLGEAAQRLGDMP